MKIFFFDYFLKINIKLSKNFWKKWKYVFFNKIFIFYIF